MIEVGQTVGNYQITSILGEGGMGRVFLAQHPVIGRKVALKAIHPQFARKADVVSRFVTEARAVNQIGHEHIVNITDFGHTPEGDFYFIMEYLPGDMLSAEIGRAGFVPRRALNIAEQIADALEASHACGVIHRDLKPDNIFLVAREGTPDFVKVFDFGLAKLTPVAGTTPTHTTSAGMVLGTPYYMAPEQCQGMHAVDHRADIYALGVILFQMLIGRLPFTGEGFGEVMAKHMSLPVPSLQSLVPSLPPAFDAIVSRAMAKDPNQRFQTMAEMRRALQAAESRHTIPPAPPASSQLTLAPARPRRGSGRMLLLGAATLAFAMFAVANAGRRQPSAVYAAARAPRQPSTVRVNVGSDPDGAFVSRPDGTVIGITPLSARVPYGDLPIQYIVHKLGYAPKVLSFVPNLSSPLFAVLDAQPAPALPSRGPASPSANRPSHPTVRRRHGSIKAPVPHPQAPVAPSLNAAADGDDVMAPSTW